MKVYVCLFWLYNIPNSSFAIGLFFLPTLPSGEVLSYLNNPNTTNMQMMKVNRRFKDQIQRSADRLFEIIELNVDEPIIFERGKRKKQLIERKNVSGKDENRKIMLVIPR
jgi:hypothetical protein